jgi:hypothetical protein
MTDSFNTKISALREAARDEAAKLVRLVAEPRGMGDTITRCIERAARRLGWSYRRTEDIWRQEARRIEAFELDLAYAATAPARPAASTLSQ